MSLRPSLLIKCVLVCGFFAFTAEIAAHQTPLWRAHAHNDYEQDRPLFEALNRGMGSIEVDIHLVDGALLVAHDKEDVDPSKTLQSMYLEPLMERVKKSGWVYEEPGAIIMLIDIKSEAAPTYQILVDVLRNYREMFTRFEGTHIEEKAVTAIISGNRPRALMLEESIRYAAFDGRLGDLDDAGDLPVSFMPLVSANWMQIERWYGAGDLSDEGLSRLKTAVDKAHAQGRKIRFWATSDNQRVWEVLYENGVDLLNADDLPAVQEFLRGKQQ